MSRTVTLMVSTGVDRAGVSYMEGTVELAGLRATKLTKKDGCTHFTTRSSLMQVANNFARTMNLTLVEKTAKLAAKKQAK